MNNWNENITNGYGYETAVQAENEMALQRYISGVMRKVYGKMTLGLALTALTALLVTSSGVLMNIFMAAPFTFLVLAFAELGMVIYLSARIEKLSNGTATALFYVYSILNGITLSPIFLIYTETSIVATFAITAGMFGAMTLAGYFTKTDLSKFGAFMYMALLGLLVCLIVNMFLKSTMMGWCISIAGVLIFVGLTAWDTQYIKRMTAEADASMVGKVATLGALRLYLDFINLFLYLLRFFGSRD